MKRFTTTMLAALFLVAILTGCSGMAGGGKKNDPTPKSLELAPFASCKEMVDEIKAVLIAEMEQKIDGSKRWMCRGSVGIDDVGEAPVEAGMGGAQATGTNLQEPGVDEADLIKTDGRFAYAIAGGEIRVLRVWPFTDFRRVATISPEGTPKGMYLRGNRLAVTSVKEEVWSGGGLVGGGDVDGSPPTLQQPAQVIEQVYDVAAPASPVLKSTRKVAGSLLDSRWIGGRLHVVVRNSISMPQLDYSVGIPYDQLPECPSSGEAQPTRAMLDKIAAMKEANRAKIEALTMAELIPFAGEVTQSDCVTAHRSRAAAGADLLTVVTGSIDGDAADLSAVTVVGNGGALYASPAALYVASRMNPWSWWATGDEPRDSTVIHRFSLEGELPQYAGSGKVEGHLVDNGYAGSRHSDRFSMAQFAMSEHAGFLRVATTVVGGTMGESESDSRVSVLDTSTPNLEEAGVVAGMGRGEKIHAVRFIGTKAFVVTFKQTDPLYVVDLKDPAAPKVAGELKIPGFSTYLHPLDETHVIGLGFSTDDEDNFAWTQGLKLSLFDVSDPANPREVNHREIGSRGSYSPAIEEHHAFTLDAKGRLALPVDIYEGGDGSSGYGTFDFAGVMLLKADLSGTFADLGTIRMVEGGGDDPYGLGYRSTAVLRTVIVGNGTTEGIVTLTAEGVQLNRIDASMTQVGGVL